MPTPGVCDGAQLCTKFPSEQLLLASLVVAHRQGQKSLQKYFTLLHFINLSLIDTCSSSKVVTLSKTKPNLLLSMESGGGADAGRPGLAVQFLLLGLGDRAPPGSRAAPRTATLARASRRPYEGVSPSCSRVGGEKDCSNKGSHLV